MIFNMVCGGSSYANKLPNFTYSGDYLFADDGDNNWHVKLLTSGTLVFNSLGNAANGIDVFCVGGGSSGGRGYQEVSDTAYNSSGEGGGGGYTRTMHGIIPTRNFEYQITIGAGGIADQTNGSDPVNGGNTSAFGIITSGGLGADGGSGGGSGSTWWYSGSYGGEGRSDGATNGGDALGKGQISKPGPNGETGNTREFGEETGTLYSKGGDGGGYQGVGADGAVNTGNGGGSSYFNKTAGNGGSGIVIIRNARG